MSDENLAEAELPLESVGARLRRAREAAGLSAAQVAAETRISLRQIEAIEAGNFSALPGRTYAIGFSRTYARAVGVNEVETAAAVREELARQQPDDPRRPVQTFEPGDPARVPSSRLTWLALGGLVAAVIGAVVLVPGLFAPSASLPSILTANPPSQPAAAVPAAALMPSGGPVVFTALIPAVWVKFYDAGGKQLLQKELAQGETYTVPADQGEVRLWTARPDALGITVGGQPVPKLSDLQKTVKDVPVSAAALLGRAAASVPAIVPAIGSGALPLANSAVVNMVSRRIAAPAKPQQRIPTPRTELSPAPGPLPTAAPLPVTAAPSPAAT